MEQTLFFRHPAPDFNETLLLGNGRLGAIVYGGVNEDIYELNDDTLWSGYPRIDARDGKKAFERAKKACLSDDPAGASAALRELYGHWSQCYLPAGTLRIRGEYGEYSDYRRSLSLPKALHVSEFRTARGRCTRTAFASHPDDVIVIRYDCPEGLPVLENGKTGKSSVLRSIDPRTNGEKE